MCGRYGLVGNPKAIKDRFDLAYDLQDFEPRYNIAPSQWLPMIIQSGGKRIPTIMRWGLLPAWAKDPSVAYKMINAKSETIEEKVSFKKPLQTQRCLVPVTGFFERKQPEEGKTPDYIHLKDDDLFAFAGLWDVNKLAQDVEIRAFTIITTEQNELVIEIHGRRF